MPWEASFHEELTDLTSTKSSGLGTLEAHPDTSRQRLRCESNFCSRQNPNSGPFTMGCVQTKAEPNGLEPKRKAKDALGLVPLGGNALFGGTMAPLQGRHTTGALKMPSHCGSASAKRLLRDRLIFVVPESSVRSLRSLRS